MADMAQYRTISREHAEVTQIAGRYARYQQREVDLAGAREMLADPRHGRDGAGRNHERRGRNCAAARR